jgi:hypothetical protein
MDSITWINLLLYVDNMVLIAEFANQVVAALQQLEVEMQQLGVTISVPKTKLMCVCVEGKAPPLPVVALRGEMVEWVSKFKYLGTLVSSSWDILVEVQARVMKAIGTFASFKPIMLNKVISLGTGMLFNMAFIPPIFRFGCECWALKPAMASHLEATHMSFIMLYVGGQPAGQDLQC